MEELVSYAIHVTVKLKMVNNLFIAQYAQKTIAGLVNPTDQTIIILWKEETPSRRGA